MTVVTGIFIGLILGIILGAGVMLFVYRNNSNKFNMLLDAREKEIENLKKKFDILRGK